MTRRLLMIAGAKVCAACDLANHMPRVKAL